MLVPVERVSRWVENFGARHGSPAYGVQDGRLGGTAPDGSTFAAALPFAAPYDGPATAAALAEAAGAAVPDDWGVLLVRKGGFAVARLEHLTTTASKVGQRHVQGRTKAGGQSQQRFARRRDNQARQAYEAAAEHAARVLGDLRGPVVAGGDRGAVTEVLADRRVTHLRVVEPWLDVPDPRRVVLEQAVLDACSVRIEVCDTTRSGP